MRLFTEKICLVFALGGGASWAAKGRSPFFAQTFEIGRCLGEAELRWIYAYRCMYLKKLAHE